MVSAITSGTGPLGPLPARSTTASPHSPAVQDPATAEATAPSSAPAAPPSDQVTVQNNLGGADFEPNAGAVFPDATEPEIELPSLDDPVTGVLRGEALEGRLKALQQEIGTQLSAAQERHATALSNIETSGIRDDLLNDVLKQQHAIDMLTQMQTLLNRNEHDSVKQLQNLLKSSAINEATGNTIKADNQYGPGTDRLAVERIRQPDSTYVDKNFTYEPKEAFVYQYGEIGENGGTSMEAQANCGPASMAMVIERLGGDAPTMKEIRQEAGAPTGNRKGTYGLDSDQVEKGLTEILGDQGIQVDTETQVFRSRDNEGVTEAMREALAAGKEVILLSANLQSGGQGHYIVVNEVREDGSIVVDDPQNEDGQGQIHTAAELEAGMKRRGAYGRDTRLITVSRAETPAT